jgi:amidophosphoribosyltransferase
MVINCRSSGTVSIGEECAVVGVYTSDKNSLCSYLHNGLAALQHRGQESVGVSVYAGKMMTLKTMGLVSESTIFSEKIKGNLGIGHNRYSTTGRSNIENAQPIETISKNGVEYSFAFNGNVGNYFELKEKLMRKFNFTTTSDAELLAYMLGRDLGEKGVWEIYRDAAPSIHGSYSALMLIGGDRPMVAAIRDPLGFKPLCIGKNSDGYFIASESVAFADCYIGAKLIRDVEPGEVIIIDESGLKSRRVFNSSRHAHCMFEWVYFARPDSIIEGIPVWKVRERLGELLADEEHGFDADYVIPVPDSGRGAASGYARASGIPQREGFQKDRYLDRRTFIMPSQGERESFLTKKLNTIPSAIRDQVIVLVDDSIVRGTSMKGMIDGLKKAGVKGVHLRVSCPPIIDWCPYGVDFYQEELIARKYADRSHEEVCRLVGEELGVNSLHYNLAANLLKAIGLPREQLCLGCLTQEYPEPITVTHKRDRKQ